MAVEDHDDVAVAYAVGRKVGGAVERNRWRRRMRAIVSERRVDLRSGAYLVVVGPDVRALTYAGLREHLVSAMQRASGATR